MAEPIRRPDRTLIVHRAVAAFSLSLAALGYCAPNIMDRETSFILYEPNPKAVTAITYDDGATQTTLTLDAGHAQQWCIEHNAMLPQAAGPQRLRAVAGAESVLARVAPLRAKRALGHVDEAHLRSFELSAQNGPRLRIKQNAGDAFEMRLGRGVYGSQQLYAWLPDRGVFIVDGDLLRGFEQLGAALWDKRLMEAQPEAIAQVSIATGGKTFRFGRSLQSQPGPFAQLPASASNSHGDAGVRDVLEQALAIEIQGPAPPLGPALPWCVIAVQGVDGSALGELHLFDHAGLQMATSTLQPGPVVLQTSAVAALRQALQSLIETL